jgi:polyhydroxyalkanoate synthase
MSDHDAPDTGPSADIARITERLAELSVKLCTEQLTRRDHHDRFQILDPFVVGRTFWELGCQMLTRPDVVMREQLAFWRGYTELWQQTLKHARGEKPGTPVIEPRESDKRFRDEHWVENYLFSFFKQCYLLAARGIESTVSQVDGVDAHTAQKAAFYTRQMLAALSPSNFVASNPQVLKATLQSKGENLLRGCLNLLQDLEAGGGRLRLKMTDPDAFALGENIAASPGAVIYQNELMQLLQYEPSTPQVHQRPLLIVPPWINKFYILDLKPKNSFIKWAVDQGHTVFVISWVNPDGSLAEKDFSDYVLEGPLAALDAIEQATGERTVNAIGYCIGGTLLACTLAYLAAGNEQRIQSATFFTSLLDFTDVGELSVFIDEEQLRLMEDHMRRNGYFDGTHMANAFNLLRENDLIWSFVINNYLLGREPLPFDLLYWNSDSTRMPERMHSTYLRNMYQRNLLKEPGGVRIAGVPIDLRSIEVPAYFVSTAEDHIAPWKSTYRGARYLSGPVRFVLGGSGHIAGVINPPAANKYAYWTNPDLAADAEQWLAGAVRQEGSWWKDWAQWVADHSGPPVPARHPGDGALRPVERAPGSYVRVRLS